MSERVLYFRHPLSELDKMVESCAEAVAEAKKREAAGSAASTSQNGSAGADGESAQVMSSDTAVEAKA